MKSLRCPKQNIVISIIITPPSEMQDKTQWQIKYKFTFDSWYVIKDQVLQGGFWQHRTKGTLLIELDWNVAYSLDTSRRTMSHYTVLYVGDSSPSLP